MKLNYVNQTLRVHIKYVALYNMIHDGRLFGFEEHNEECLFSQVGHIKQGFPNGVDSWGTLSAKWPKTV